MRSMQLIILGLPIAATCSFASAQQAINISDEFPITSILLMTNQDDDDKHESQLKALTLDELSLMRASGVDPSWINNRILLPEFDPSQHRITQGDHPLTVESWATHYTNPHGVQLNDSVRFAVGRSTELRDGNISGNEGTLDSTSGRDHIPSLAQSEGEYDIYDISLEWDAFKAGPVTLSLLSGLKAIEANIGKRITKNGDTSIDSVHRFTALPMVGSGIRWQISDNLSFSGAALTHPVETGDALMDFNASTDLRISNNIGLITGYRIIRSSFDVGTVRTDLTQEGLFARLEISF